MSGCALVIAVVVAVPTGALADNVTRSAKVKGTADIRIKTVSGDITVTKGKSGQVTATYDTSRPNRVTFDVNKNTIRIAGGSPSDDIQVTVPSRSTIVLGTTSGDVSVTGVGGVVRGRVTSGSLEIDGAGDVDAVAVSGDIKLDNVAGDVRVKVVSGSAVIDQGKRDDVRLALETVSGDIEWRGRCGKGCRMDLESLSGDLDLYIDKKSSFDVEFRTRSGDFKNRANAKIKKSSRSSTEATFGTGLGRISAQTFSGDLRIATQ